MAIATFAAAVSAGDTFLLFAVATSDSVGAERRFHEEELALGGVEDIWVGVNRLDRKQLVN